MNDQTIVNEASQQAAPVQEVQAQTPAPVEGQVREEQKQEVAQ